MFDEMNARQTTESKSFKAIDSMEALIQHNESSLDTWSENEFELNLHYADDKVAFSQTLAELREAIRSDTIPKINTEK